MDMIQISTELLDREDLDLHARMCCIYLAREAQLPGREPLTPELLALRMGCSLRTVRKALNQLVEKGLLIEVSGEGAGEDDGTHRVRKRDMQSPTAAFKPFDAPPRLSPAEQLKALRTFIHEPATDGTLRIILNTAGGDVERIRLAYRSAAASQIGDTLEALMHLLQQQDTPPERREEPARPTPPGPVPDEMKADGPDIVEPETRQVLTQINQRRIAELYSKSRRKP